MPVVKSRGAWLKWESHGSGEPLLLIMGLGGSSLAWTRLLPHVSAVHRAIVLDNRGTGDSDRVGPGRLTMADMVADALAVLDAAGEESAHVMGVSMGGMIAQHLALDHRERVRSLILACTSAVGRQGAPSWRMLASTALRPVIGPMRTWDLVVPALYARGTDPARIEEDLALRGAAEPTPTQTFVAQIGAISRHDTRKRLHELEGLGVTVVHGREDRLVRPQRAAALASAIPGADLVIIDGCAHMLTTDAEQASAAAVLAHLAQHASPHSSVAA